MKYRRGQTGEREGKTVWPEQEAGGPGHLEAEGRICPPWRRRRNGLGGCQGLDVKLKETGWVRQGGDRLQDPLLTVCWEETRL